MPGPAQATRNEIVAAVPQHLQIGFVRLDDATFHIPNTNPDDVGIDQAPDLRLTLLEE